MFGVGRRDETLLNSGITHTVEHLALKPLGVTTYSSNGSVGPTTTRFTVLGGPEQVIEFFDRLTKSLRNLPVERLAEELRILRVEASKRSPGQLGFDLSLRFGPKGVGLLGWPEHGFRRIEAEEVKEWADSWFTTQNAILWISRPIPGGLRLGHLAQGQGADREMQRSLAPSRCFAGIKTRSVSLSVLTEQQMWGLIPAFSIARQRAFGRLRQQEALSYAVDFVHLRIGDGQALEYLSADGDGESNRRLFDGLTHIIEELADNGPSSQELQDFNEFRKQMLDDPRTALGYLDSTCERTLLGLPADPPEEADIQLDSLTPESVQADLTSTMHTLVAVGPQELAGDLPGWPAFTNWSSELVQGQTFEAIIGREQGQLIVGQQGLTWRRDRDRWHTISWDEVEACLTWESGTRSVIGPTGIVVGVTPWNWQGGRELTSLVDAGIPSERRIAFGEGETQYLRNANDPESITDRYWLGSIMGAHYRQQPVSVVITTEGVLILHGEAPEGGRVLRKIPVRGASDEERAEKKRLRMKELRSGDRETLLAANKYNKWLPQEVIERATLSKKTFGTPHDSARVLFLSMTGGGKVKIQLKEESQVKVAKQLANVIGRRFEG
jgi:hypothetical protein